MTRFTLGRANCILSERTGLISQEARAITADSDEIR